MAKKNSAEVQESKDLSACMAELQSLKADVRNLYRELGGIGMLCRTGMVREKIFRLLERHHALPV